MNDLITQVLNKDKRAAARLIRAIDDCLPQAQEVLKQLYAHTGGAYVVGVTGSPGVGKSTLTNGLITHLRRQGKTVGVLAVDPSSPFSGGAILGDRIRMQQHSTDDGVFIRSLATRGQMGGISRATHGAIMVLDAFGKDCIIVETVGAGQDEIDIVRMAKTTVVILVPGLGDGVQAIKSGILEAGDIFVVNKADRPGVEQTVSDLKTALSMSHKTELGSRDWLPPVIETVAVKGEGIAQLWNAVEDHGRLLMEGRSEYYRRMNRLKGRIELLEIVKGRVLDAITKKVEEPGYMDAYIEELLNRKCDPYTLSDKILSRVMAESDLISSGKTNSVDQSNLCLKDKNSAS
jgi:LAO/AO transport system kinase